MQIRNIAIIAHVDHGKTTLTDALMKQNGGLEDEGVSMDSNDLEKERGITIYSKNTSIYYPSKDSGRPITKINIVDTPGHADFGSEVERVLRAIDSVLLLVDAVEGPMPQTRFVLKKSLELGLKPIVVINKIDKPAADPDRVHSEILDLFFELGANEEQANFETVYAIGRQGLAFRHLGDKATDLSPLLDVILEKVPPASEGEEGKMSAQVFNLGYDNFLGRMAVARIYSGKIKTASQVFIKGNQEGQEKTRKGKITKLFVFEGIKRKETDFATSGDIVLLAGIPDIYIGETICEDESVESLPHIAIDEPTLSLNFLVNDSPFAGQEGKFVTSRQIKERLEKELEINVGLKVDFSPDQGNKMGPSFFKVYGRGELHIAILLENMRREGFEMQVSQPEVIIKEKDGIKTEPSEELVIDVPMEFSGSVIEKIGKRRGLMKNMTEKEGIARIVFDIPTRGLLGYRSEFIIDTKGEGIMSSRVTGFKEYAGEIKKREYGSMVSMVAGKAVAFSLANLQERGILYVGHGTEVYEGMVIGNVLKGDDMSVNPTKGKQLTNMRASGTDEAIVLNPVFTLSIERGLEVMNEDEYLEVTPKSVRLRKKYLTELDRVKSKEIKNMSTITFKPQKITKKITSHLADRALDVVMNRFGLTVDGKKKTLEEIGKKYNITRERVRQVEEAAMNLIKKSDAYKNEQAVFDELRQIVHNLGSIVAEHEFLPYVSKDKNTQNHINFFLVLADVFKKHREDEHFHTRYSVDDAMADKVHEALRKLYTSLKDEDLIPETEMIKKFFEQMKDCAEECRDAEMAKRWLSISKTIAKNELGEWGKASSPNIRARGVKDYAFLVMRRHGSPMHFREVADSISKTFGKKIHYATCHNELIKDPRFVLVGRGMYALAEWGYKAGIAREVIEDILKKEGAPLSREEIVKRVMKERYFKKNTILVNLANLKYFKKNKEGLYSIA